MLNLFDDTKRKTLPIAEYIPSFQTLNHFDWPGAECTRSHLDFWFQRFPSSSRASLRSRFRSDNDRDHEGALFELFLHELFIQLDCAVEVNPEVADGRTPDFLVEQRDRRFYLEATVVGEHLGPFTLSPNERDVMEKLNGLDSEHFDIRVHMEGTLLRTLGRREVVQPFERLLTTHEPESVRRLIATRGRSAAPAERINSGNWFLDGRLVPKNPERQKSPATTPIVRGSWRARYTDSVRPVRTALEKKAKRYPTLDAPLVVAVNTRDAFYNGRPCDLEVLFGREQLLYPAASPDAPPTFGRAQDGAWSAGKGGRVSAFLRFQRVDFRNLFQATASLYVHPQKSHAVLPEAAFRLPHAMLVDEQIEWTEGEDIADLVGWSRRCGHPPSITQG